MPASSEQLWALAYSTLTPKAGHTPERTLNRLVNERFPGMPVLDIQSATCTIREELWPLEKLGTLELRHSDGKPRRDGGAIIAAECREHILLVDGNNRVNYWRVNQVQGPHRVVIITCPRIAR